MSEAAAAAHEERTVNTDHSTTGGPGWEPLRGSAAHRADQPASGRGRESARGGGGSSPGGGGVPARAGHDDHGRRWLEHHTSTGTVASRRRNGYSTVGWRKCCGDVYYRRTCRLNVAHLSLMIVRQILQLVQKSFLLNM